MTDDRQGSASRDRTTTRDDASVPRRREPAAVTGERMGQTQQQQGRQAQDQAAPTGGELTEEELEAWAADLRARVRAHYLEQQALLLEFDQMNAAQADLEQRQQQQQQQQRPGQSEVEGRPMNGGEETVGEAADPLAGRDFDWSKTSVTEREFRAIPWTTMNEGQRKRKWKDMGKFDCPERRCDMRQHWPLHDEARRESRRASMAVEHQQRQQQQHQQQKRPREESTGPAERSRRRQRRTEQCHHCWQYGHWARDCPQRQQALQTVAAAAPAPAPPSLPPRAPDVVPQPTMSTRSGGDLTADERWDIYFRWLAHGTVRGENTERLQQDESSQSRRGGGYAPSGRGFRGGRGRGGRN